MVWMRATKRLYIPKTLPGWPLPPRMHMLAYTIWWDTPLFAYGAILRSLPLPQSPYRGIRKRSINPTLATVILAL